MAGQTPRNWKIDLPHARMQAVASRASAMSIIREKASGDPRDRHAAFLDLSISLRSKTRDDRRRVIATKNAAATSDVEWPSDGVACRPWGSTMRDISLFLSFFWLFCINKIANSPVRYVYKIFRNSIFRDPRVAASVHVRSRRSHSRTEFEKFSRRSDIRCDLWFLDRVGKSLFPIGKWVEADETVKNAGER